MKTNSRVSRPAALQHAMAREIRTRLSSHFVPAPENMYVYDGEDYSKPSEADKKTFDQILAGIVHVM